MHKHGKNVILLIERLVCAIIPVRVYFRVFQHLIGSCNQTVGPIPVGATIPVLGVNVK